MIRNGVLVCDKCETPMGRAPAGANDATKALCRDCTRLLPGSGFVPYAEQAVNVQHLVRPDSPFQNWAAHERHLGEPSGVRISGLKRPSISRTLSAHWLDRVVAMKSEYIGRAWRNNEPWAAAAKTEFIIKLPQRRLCAFLLVAFFDLSTQEVSLRLGIREHSVRYNVMLAKRDLIGMLKGAPPKKFFNRKNPKKDFHFSTEAYVT